MIIRYLCECCDRLVEEVFVSEELMGLLQEDKGVASLTGLNQTAIMNLESQGSLVLETLCPECLTEFEIEPDGAHGVIGSIIN